VDWDCTLADLAEATKLPVSVVRYICTVRDWPVAEADRRGPPLRSLTSIFTDNFSEAFA
jgi:hypothetical protein